MSKKRKNRNKNRKVGLTGPTLLGPMIFLLVKLFTQIYALVQICVYQCIHIYVYNIHTLICVILIFGCEAETNYCVDFPSCCEFLGAKAPLQPTSSEGLFVCLSVCMSVCIYVCNILTSLH